MKMATKNSLACLPIIKEITRKLSYYSANDNLEYRRLSIIGGPLWLLTYAAQHLVDPTTLELENNIFYNTNGALRAGLGSIRESYQDLARTINYFYLVADDFMIQAGNLRETGASILKELQKQFKFSKDPFLIHPKINIKHQRTRPKIKSEDNSDKANHANKGNITTTKKVTEDRVIEFHWSYLTVFYKGLAPYTT